MAGDDPIAPVLRRQGALILDGGLATELEAVGADLSGGLWSASCLRHEEELIRHVHSRYLEAGADCITSASYQATLEGFVAAGESETTAADLLRRSVQLAVEARDSYWGVERNRCGRERPLVAVSIGPYGAFLADGSEYTGDYGLEEKDLIEFHRRRWDLLSSCGAELVACETIPVAMEATALRCLLDATPGARAWFSFCCRDGHHLADGSPLVEALAAIAGDPQIVAVGVNCVAPRHVSSLLAEARSVTDKPLVAYPNSGERYDATDGAWSPGGVESDLASLAVDWHEAGARLIGGCCRTGPDDIRALRQRLLPAIS